MTFIIVIGTLWMLALQAGNRDAETWAFVAKIVSGLGAMGGLGAVAGAWTLIHKLRKQWFDLAAEWAKSEEFRTAIDVARRDKMERVILEMHNEIERRIDVHNSRDNLDAHRATILHVLRNELYIAIAKYDFERQIRDLTNRIEKLEKRRSP